MGKKMTSEEIRIAGESILAIEREERKRATRDAVIGTPGGTMANRNTDDDSKWIFEKYTGWSWRD